jgi:hypothetical protein
VFVALSTTLHAADALGSRTFLDGKLSMQVPITFVPMDAATKRAKYPGANAPAYVLTNGDGSTNIAFDHKQVAVSPDEIPKLEAPMREQFSGMKINSSGTRQVNGTSFLMFDFDSPSPEGDIRNLLLMSSLEGRLLVISYNCLPARNASCASMGRQLIESISISRGSSAK